MKKRIEVFRREHKDILQTMGYFLGFGGIYSIFVLLTGLGIPCIFYKLTGYCCPGCGVSRFFLCLLRLDFAGALSQNLAVGVLLPLWLGIGVIEFFFNPRALDRGSVLNKVLLGLSIVFAVAFGILRNLPRFAFLLPK